MDHSAGASSEHLEARSELLLVTSLELAAAKGTVGKLSISAFRWRRQREPSEASLAISTAMDHVGKIVLHGKIPKLTDTGLSRHELPYSCDHLSTVRRGFRRKEGLFGTHKVPTDGHYVVLPSTT